MKNHQLLPSVFEFPDAAAGGGSDVADEEVQISLVRSARELPVEVCETFLERVLGYVEVDLSLGQIDMDDISVLDHAERTALSGLGADVAH